jgi:hypothetical protein
MDGEGDDGQRYNRSAPGTSGGFVVRYVPGATMDAASGDRDGRLREIGEIILRLAGRTGKE